MAAVAGLVLAAATTWWLIVVGLLAMLAAWGYTGGPKPYGYLGLGELFVFVFFGLVATVGTTYVVDGAVPGARLAGRLRRRVPGVRLLVVNNLRDIPTDTAAGKRTLAVRLGDRRDPMAVRSVHRRGGDRRSSSSPSCGGRGRRIALAGLVAAVPPIRAVRSGARAAS